MHQASGLLAFLGDDRVRGRHLEKPISLRLWLLRVTRPFPGDWLLDHQGLVWGIHHSLNSLLLALLDFVIHHSIEQRRLRSILLSRMLLPRIIILASRRPLRPQLVLHGFAPLCQLAWVRLKFHELTPQIFLVLVAQILVLLVDYTDLRWQNLGAPSIQVNGPPKLLEVEIAPDRCHRVQKLAGGVVELK